MKTLIFGRNINGTRKTGIADFRNTPPTVYCYCTEIVAKEIIDAIEIAKQISELAPIIDTMNSIIDEGLAISKEIK